MTCRGRFWATRLVLLWSAVLALFAMSACKDPGVTTCEADGDCDLCQSCANGACVDDPGASSCPGESTGYDTQEDGAAMDTDTDIDTSSDTGTDIDADTDTDVDTDIDTDTDTDADADTDTDTDADSDTDTDPDLPEIEDTDSSDDLPLLTENGDNPSVAVGSDGNPVFSFTEGVSHEVRVGHCIDVQCTGAAINTIGDCGFVTGSTSLDIGTDGFPVVAYRNYDEAQIILTHCTDIACTDADSTVIADFFAGKSSVTIGSDGYPVVSYYASSADNYGLRVVHCEDVSCSSFASQAVTNEVSNGRESSISINAGGLPVMSFVDTRADPGALMVAQCDDLECQESSMNYVDDVDNATNTSMAIGSDLLPIIIYSTETHLKVAHCENAACDNFSLTEIDETNSFNGGEIVIDTQGLPIVSYYYEPTNDLRFARCDNPKCSSAAISEIKTSDVSWIENIAGIRSSLVFGVDERPLMIFRNSGEDYLDVAWCSRMDCGQQ